MICEQCNKEYKMLWVEEDSILCDDCCDENQDEYTWTSIIEDFVLTNNQRVNIENNIFIIKEES